MGVGGVVLEFIWNLILILQALLTPAIGGIMVYIAYQQWRTNDLKLKMDLYDRRLRIYKEVIGILVRAIEDAAERSELGNLMEETAEADFLFDKNIREYINEIHSHGRKLLTAKRLNANYKVIAGVDPVAEIKKMEIEGRWFAAQVEGDFQIARGKFEKYLNISMI